MPIMPTNLIQTLSPVPEHAPKLASRAKSSTATVSIPPPDPPQDAPSATPDRNSTNPTAQLQTKDPRTPSSISSESSTSSAATSYKHVVSSIPSSIEYTSDSIFLLCQLRPNKDNSALTAYALNSLHCDGSAPEFIRTLVTLTFKTQPTPPSIHNKIDLRSIAFVGSTGSSPTYSLRFSTVLNVKPGQTTTYARHNTPPYTNLQTFLHSFVFEKWHTRSPINLNVPPSAIQSVQFLIPTVNHPVSKPIAYISGLPPQLFGKKYPHTSLLIDSLHSSVCPHLGASKLHHLAYFKQALGIQAHNKYTLKQNQHEELYLLHVSNVQDQYQLSKIHFSPQTHSQPITILGVPVAFLPIASRPPAHDSAGIKLYYTNLDQTIHDIRARKEVIYKIPHVTTDVFKDPLHPDTRETILKNKHILTYTMVHAYNKPIQTRLFLKHALPDSDQEGAIRSWFSKDERQAIFSPMTTTSTASPLPSDKLLSNVFRSLPSSLDIFAKTLGFDVLAPTPATPSTLGDASISSVDHNAPTAPPVPTFAPPPIITQPQSITNVHLEPLSKKRPPSSPASIASTETIENSPKSPPTTTNTAATASSFQLPATQPLGDLATPDPITIPDQPTAPTKSTSSSTKPSLPCSTPSHDDSDSDDESLPLDRELSVRILSHSEAIYNAVPSELKAFVQSDILTDLAHFVYKSGNEIHALQQAQSDLIAHARKSEKKYKKIFKKKKKSSKKKTKLATTHDV